MPLSDNDFGEAKKRVWEMFQNTLYTFEVIAENANSIYGERAEDVRAAIKECLDDFIYKTNESGETSPEKLILTEASRENFQKSGFYGAQLKLKEREVTEANANLRDSIKTGIRQVWLRPFKKWIDIINNFLGSLISATGLNEALKELKDCLRNELPDDE